MDAFGLLARIRSQSDQDVIDASEAYRQYLAHVDKRDLKSMLHRLSFEAMNELQNAISDSTFQVILEQWYSDYASPSRVLAGLAGNHSARLLVGSGSRYFEVDMLFECKQWCTHKERLLSRRTQERQNLNQLVRLWLADKW
jgi:uncharacterized protein YdiU (UPF0061 family)